MTQVIKHYAQTSEILTFFFQFQSDSNSDISVRSVYIGEKSVYLRNGLNPTIGNVFFQEIVKRISKTR